MPLRGVTGTFAAEFSEKGKAKPQGTQLSKREGAAEMQDKKKKTSRELWRCKVLRRKAVNAGLQGKWKGQKEMEELCGKNRINFLAITPHPQ